VSLQNITNYFYSVFSSIDIAVKQGSKRSTWKKVLYFVCGLSEDLAEEKKTTEEQKTHFRDVISLKQDPKAEKFLYVNCLLVLIICVFLMVYFTIPDGGPTKPTIEFPYAPFVNEGKRPYEWN